MGIRAKPGQVSDLAATFKMLSAQPGNEADKLQLITTAANLCVANPSQLRQAQRVGKFLAVIMGDTKQEPLVQMFAIAALHTMMNTIRPVEAFTGAALQVTRRWNLGTPEQRVHAEALVKAVRLHTDAAQLRAAASHKQKVDKSASSRPAAKKAPFNYRDKKREKAAKDKPNPSAS